MRQKVYAHLLQTRGWKYRSFLRYLRFFKYIFFSPIRGDFLESYYTLMRYIDDIVDGYTPLPDGYHTSVEYVEAKLKFSRTLANPVDEADYLLLYCFQLADKFGENFTEETNDILSSLLFDAHRKGKDIVFPEEELMHHFHLLAVRGTIRATLKLFKESPDKYELLSPLGIATRIYYDLQDYKADLEAGYINISREDCFKFDIQPEAIRFRSHPTVQNWFRHQASKGMLFLEEHHENLKLANFSWLTRVALPLVYEYPARNFFKNVLAEEKESGNRVLVKNENN